MSWIFIAIAVVFEVTVGIAAGKAQGFKNIPWTATTLIAGALGTYFLSLALLSFAILLGRWQNSTLTVEDARTGHRQGLLCTRRRWRSPDG